MLVGRELSQAKPKIKKIFFYRICGTGMGACACLAKEAGFEVAGADTTFSPPMSTYLESVNIPLRKLELLTREELKEYDLIVVGNSVPRQSEFARFVEETGVPFTSFPSFLGEFILQDKEVIGLAGTHGKTTTTYFLSQMLEALGEDTGYFIGGIIDGRPPSRLGTSKYFVIESDEYDSAYFQKISKFRLYELNHMVLTSLEFDHADIFNSIEDIKNEFKPTLASLSGTVIANDGFGAITDLSETFKDLDWTFYGEGSAAGPVKIESINGRSHFSLKLGNSYVDFDTNIVGLHNILNISSCILMLDRLGFNTVELQSSVMNLEMVKRRQEHRGYFQKAVVIDDFAHHPRAISLTVDAIKTKYPDKEIITIFEPVSATARSSIFQNEFLASLTSSNKVLIAKNALQTTVEDKENLDTTLLVEELTKQGIAAQSVNTLDELMKYIKLWANERSVLLVLSNRTCLGLWESDFVKQLS